MKVIILAILTVFGFALDSEKVLKSFTNGNNLFASSLYKEVLKKEHRNFLASPFSGEIILSLVLIGAKEETAKEIRTGLRLPISDRKTKSAIKSLLSLMKSDGHYTLCAANKIYVKQNISIKNQFRKLAKEVFHAVLENMNFSDRAGAADSINKWVEQQTNNKIHELLDPDKLRGDTTLILVNSLYFKANWMFVFDKFLTKKSKFYKTATNIIQVDTMYSNNLYAGYYENRKLNAKFLELPFEGHNISMVLILPNEIDGISFLETQEKLFVPPKFHPESIDLALPKFKIETKIDFKEILRNLGVNKAFLRNEADFSGISGEKGGLWISEVIQKALVAINEGGIDATSAAYLGDEEAVVDFGQNKSKKFVADHPFIFYIKIRNVVLFVGRVSVPNQ